MQLYDKDLLSMQEVRELVGAAKKAQQELAGMTQEQVDRIVRAIADAGVRNARRLAEMANEDTGFGKVEDKVIKNVFGSRGVYEYIKDMKTVGELERDEVNKTRTIAVPVGVIAGLIPSTNPTSTALYKSEIAIKAGNAIVFSPHPTALRCIMETVKVIRQAISEAGGNENLVSCITIPTMEATDNLMRHRDVALILATGGSAMVRAAYSSGTPAIGVGPGNGPAYLEKTCDLPLAVKRILDSKTFDWGTICASEQSIICDEDMAAAVQAEMEKQGAYFLDDAERAKLGKFILRANGTMNPEIVGRSVETIAKLAGLDRVPVSARVLVAREDGVGRGHPYSNEKLGPILALRGRGPYVLHAYQGRADGRLFCKARAGFPRDRQYRVRAGRYRRLHGAHARADAGLRRGGRLGDERKRRPHAAAQYPQGGLRSAGAGRYPAGRARLQRRHLPEHGRRDQ